MSDQRITNILLTIIATPIVVMVLKWLDFIFIPLVFAMFITLLFIPTLRKLKRRGVHKILRVFSAILFILLVGFSLFHLIRLTSQEILATKQTFIDQLHIKLAELNSYALDNFGFSIMDGVMQGEEIRSEWIIKNLKSFSVFLIDAIPQLLTTLFFVILLLFESFDFERMLNTTILKRRFSSIKTFQRIEKDIVTFLQVKFLVSLGTGIGTSLMCYAFDVSFPIFWGVFAFGINFVQMVGSIITIVLLSLFAFVELEFSSTLLYFIISITSVQVVFGSILEPIFMGKSFSINIIVVLSMLMFWGFVWGIPGMILSIPLTVFIKIILEQFDKTKRIAQLMK